MAAPLVLANEAGALALQNRVVDIYRDHEKAVVKVHAAFNNRSSEGKTVVFIGTGFYISKEGHILTNTNVTYGAERIWVESEGIHYAAELIGSDPLTNVSIIKVFELPKDFAFLRFTDTPEIPPVGSFLVALSCELGQDPGPSLGMVTGWNTNYGERFLPTIYLRSDIPSDGGEGGAPVFDLNGSLVGMLIVALPELRSSFILPARAIQRIRDDILFSGKVTFAFFGFEAIQRSDLDNGPWVEIERVEDGSPAAEAGIQTGDHILRMGDFPIKTSADLRVASFFQRPEQFVTLELKRGEEMLDVSVKPGEREAPPTAMPPIGPSVPGPEEGTIIAANTETDSAIDMLSTDDDVTTEPSQEQASSEAVLVPEAESAPTPASEEPAGDPALPETAPAEKPAE